jgi:hypothetical protein
LSVPGGNWIVTRRSNGRSKAVSIEWLPSVNAKLLKQHIADDAVIDMESVQDSLLNEGQQCVKTCTLSGETFLIALGLLQT